MTGPAWDVVLRDPLPGRRRAFVAVSTMCCLAAGLLFLGRKGFWLDELFSAAFAAAPADAFRSVVSEREANMSLYYLLLRAWSALGQGDAFLRVPSVLFGAACVPALHALGRRLAGERAALFAAGMLPLHGFLVVHAREVRGYSMMLLLVLLSAIFFLRMADGGWRRRDAAAFAVLGALAAWTHVFALLATAAMGVSLLFRPRSSVRAGRALVAFAAWGAAVAPLLAFMATRDRGQIDWMPSPFPHELIAFGKQLCGRSILLVPPFAFLAGLGLLELVRRLRARGAAAHPEAVLLLLCLLLPPAAALAVSVAKPVFLKRYLIGTLPPFLLVCGIGLATLRSPEPVILAAAWLLAGQIVKLPDQWNTPREDWRAVVRDVRAQALPGDGVVCVRQPHGAPMAFERYGAVPMDSLSPAPPLVSPSRFDLAAFGAGSGLEPAPADAVRAAAACRRVWLLVGGDGRPGAAVPAGYEAIGRKRSERRYEKLRVILLERG